MATKQKKAGAKSDVHQKVQEIKKRQQNWMLERNKAQQSHSNEDSTKQILSESSSNSGFTRWKQARKESTETQRSASIEHPQIDNTRSLCEKPLSPASFDDVADRIANRVKNELRISSHDRSAPEASASRSSCGNASAESSPSTNYSDHDSDVAETLSNHICPQCRKTMIDSREPMLVIPCGHNVCRQCSKDDDLCPVCSCEVQSFTCNIMLKQVISNFKRDLQKNQRSHNVSSSRTDSGRGSRHKDETDYTEELRSLMMRLEILESECDNIRDVMRVIKQDISSEQKQISLIGEEEERVKKDMENLAKKLDALHQHKTRYHDNIERLEEKHHKESDKLDIVRETIRELNRGVEQIQLRCTSDR